MTYEWECVVSILYKIYYYQYMTTMQLAIWILIMTIKNNNSIEMAVIMKNLMFLTTFAYNDNTVEIQHFERFSL